MKDLIDKYPGADYVYYGARAYVVARCLDWILDSDAVRARFRLRRWIAGNEWTCPEEWEFFMRWDQISEHDLSSGRLRGGNLADCVVLDPLILAAAESIGLDSDDSMVRSFKDKVIGLDCQQSPVAERVTA